MPNAIHASAGQQPSESAPDSEVDGAVLAEWVGTRKFSTTWLRPGYDEEEVDAFLKAIRDTFLGMREPSLTPDEIRNQQFSTTRLRPGYDKEEVDAFLDEVELRLAARAGARAHATPHRPVAAGAAQIRCPECGADNAETTEVCARCGAPTSDQPPAADRAVAPRAGRSGPSRWLLITVGMATALVVVGGLIARSDHSRSSTSSIPLTARLTIYQLRTGDCLQDPSQDIINVNQGNGPFTAGACTQLHTAEVFFVGNAWPRSLAYPGDQAVYEDGYARCLTAFSAYDGIDNSSSGLYIVASTPDRSTWPGGDRRLVCFAADAGGSLDYSIRGSNQ